MLKTMIYHFNIAKQHLYACGLIFFSVLTLLSCQHEIEVTDSFMDQFEEQETEVIHPIDLFLTGCLEDTNNYTTMGMTQCTIDAFEQWEKQLDSVSARLREILPIEILELFERSQTSWDAYFEAQSAFSDELYSQTTGTMYIPIRVDNHLELLRERVLMLEDFLNEAETLNTEMW